MSAGARRASRGEGMELSARVLWREGMPLAQHHFQGQSRYFERSIAAALTSLHFKPYGLAGLELDAEALRNGTVALVHARGIMPDGLPFQFPEADPLPEPRDIRSLFSPTTDVQRIHLAIPPYRPGAANCTLEEGADGGDRRFVAAVAVTPDDTTGEDSKPVGVARKNFVLLLDGELTDGLVSLPVAQVRRDGAGQLAYDAEYVPPVLQIGASERVMGLLQRLVEILETKADALAQEGRARRAPRDVASYWLAHAIQTALVGLRHHLTVRRSRPEALYLELSRLAGALCTFALDAHPRTLPAYDHDGLGDCLTALDRHIRAHLDLAASSNAIAIPLERSRKLLLTGTVADRRCFAPTTRWVLGVRPGAAAVDAASLVSSVPQLVKVCSAQHIARLVKEAFPGLPLEHLPIPPSGLAASAGTHYFQMGQTGPCWASLTQTGEVGIYVPQALASVELELWVLLQADAGAPR
jgi:type VI secretion system protein ImpJ